MPFNPLDVSLSKQSPNQMWVKSISEQATKQIFPNATYYPKPMEADRKSVVYGKSVDLGGRRIIKKKTKKTKYKQYEGCIV